MKPVVDEFPTVGQGLIIRDEDERNASVCLSMVLAAAIIRDVNGDICFEIVVGEGRYFTYASRKLHLPEAICNATNLKSFVHPAHFVLPEPWWRAHIRFTEATFMASNSNSVPLRRNQKEVTLPTGLIVFNGSFLREIGVPLKVQIDSIDMSGGQVTSKPLPDRSVVRFPFHFAEEEANDS